MKVKEIMTLEPKTCTPDTSVAVAAHLMWDGDCGILPVVDDGELVGVVTDRDLYIALATRNARASQLPVGAVATSQLATCAPEEDVHVALSTMKQHHVRRLPVVGFGGTVLGILSMDDLVRASAADGPLQPVEVVETLKSIYTHHHPAPHVLRA